MLTSSVVPDICLVGWKQYGDIETLLFEEQVKGKNWTLLLNLIVITIIIIIIIKI